MTVTFHFLKAATLNAREPITVLHLGSTKRHIPEDRSLRLGMYEECRKLLVEGNFNLKISLAPQKAKSWEPAYSLALSQNKVDRQVGPKSVPGQDTGR